ncbi:MAG TPA: tetratricopeptide repeat protein [Gemmatimonadaceae bacterium]|jgi:predicted Zn-dependent protease|nr:tetratricopeptide repeat protein [Gemmatimonadaceae bacterium]
MTNAPLHGATNTGTASTSVFVATFTGVLAVTALLLVLDLFLAGVDHRESEAHAAAEYDAGRALLASGHPDQAGEHFGTAVAVDRGNVSYALALAEATLEQGRLVEAEATLRGLLDRAENDGAVNLTMAHVMVREQKPAEAKAYFHRAIFGHWASDSVARRTQARLELIDLLVRQGAARELLAELLPFEDVSPDSIPFRVRLGQLFIAAGSPTRAATTFRAVLRRDPRNPDAYAGMGQAALELGNLRTARADVATAARLRPADTDIARRLATIDSVIALDPTDRDVGESERYARSRALLGRTIAVVGLCPQAGGPAISDSVRAMPSATVPARRQQTAAETMVQAAIDVWGARPAQCAAAARDTVLRLVHVHLAQ